MESKESELDIEMDPQRRIIAITDELSPAALRQLGNISLLDYFAGQALSGLLADTEVDGKPSNVALVAYNYADAMLLARMRRLGEGVKSSV